MQADLSPEDLKVKMAETLQFFGTESKIRLYEAWTQATMKREGKFAKAVGFCEDFGNQYNKLKLWQKLGLGALALGTSVATGGGAMATGMLVARRAAAGLGSFAMFEGVLEKISQKMASNTMENKAGEAMTGLEKKEGAEARLNHLMDTLKSEMSEGNLRQELHDRAKGKTLRTISAAALSLGMMFGIPAGADYLKNMYFGTEVTEVAKGAGVVAQTASENGNLTPTPMGSSGTIAQEQLKNVFQGGADSHADTVAAPSGAATEVAKTVAEAPAGVVDGSNIYEVSKGDTVDGLIGSYLSEHYSNFDDMSEGQKTHAINALERQLRHLSPEQLKLAGIGSGNIHSIQVKELVDLDKLFSADDADKVMGKAAKISAEAVKSIEANNEQIAEWATKNPGVPINEVTIENRILHPHTGVAGDVAHVRGMVPADPVSSADDSTVTQLQDQLRTANAKIDMLHQGYEELKHLPRAENWSSQIFGIAPNESLGASTKTFEQIKDIRIADIRNDVNIIQENRAMYADAQEIKGVTGEKTGLLGWQLKSFTDFSNSKDGALKLSTYLKSLPWDMQNKVTLGDYIKHVTPLVKQGDRLGASGLFTTSI
jgi:TolA-binding protein